MKITVSVVFTFQRLYIVMSVLLIENYIDMGSAPPIRDFIDTLRVINQIITTSVKEDMFSSLFVCLLVSLLTTLRKSVRTISVKFLGKVGPMNK